MGVSDGAALPNVRGERGAEPIQHIPMEGENSEARGAQGSNKLPREKGGGPHVGRAGSQCEYERLVRSGMKAHNRQRTVLPSVTGSSRKDVIPTLKHNLVVRKTMKPLSSVQSLSSLLSAMQWPTHHLHGCYFGRNERRLSSTSTRHVLINTSTDGSVIRISAQGAWPTEKPAIFTEMAEC